ncbi:hypothetical protein O3P69_012281 [Scylla paramamosain]|uniref:Archease domain-containing protein n=1 Tax=Scylla paramamosain TaxID=85552 RepID=A0AAW0TDG9_SCYPA
MHPYTQPPPTSCPASPPTPTKTSRDVNTHPSLTHHQGTEVKAITYASMQVYDELDQHEVFVIVDIRVSSPVSTKRYVNNRKPQASGQSARTSRQKSAVSED